uniref:hypothetical protein n=1 Tax=Clostridium sp. Marseille-Q2269 TaxID=2942205 RepID=UPI0020731947
MIFNILNIKFKILKNRITNEFSKKDIINIVLFIIISMIGLIFFIVHLLKKFNVSYSSVVVANNLILFVTCILMTSTIPLKIYKDYFKNQKIEILFLSPVTLKQCFLYQIIILLAKILSIYFVITLPLLIAFVYKLNLNIIYILNYIIYNSIFLSIFSLILHLFVFLIALITNAKYIKKVLVVVTGIIEIIFTSIVIL